MDLCKILLSTGVDSQWFLDLWKAKDRSNAVFQGLLNVIIANSYLQKKKLGLSLAYIAYL